jgi:hypothetical protein
MTCDENEMRLTFAKVSQQFRFSYMVVAVQDKQLRLFEIVVLFQ